jgi:glycosyltransferase involved in cell wall biosynthesis
MKKIIHLLYSGLGGHGSVFFSLVRADKKKLFHTEAVFCGIEKVRDDYVDQCKQLVVPFRSIRKKRGFDPLVYLRLYNAFKKAKPDILFLHGATFILPAILYKRFHRSVKIIVRDTQAHHLKSKREWYWLKLAIRHSYYIVFLTKESQEGVIEKMKNFSLQKKTVVIPNGLDTNLYSPEPSRDLALRIVIGMQSRLQPIKDHPTLLKAFALLIKRYPNRQLVLRIAGDGETRAALERLAEELQIDKQTEFCGMLNEKDLIDFMHSLDIYVHASFGETMSNSIMQAMACGLPVIASDVWGINNMVVNNENGILFTSKDESQLYNCLDILIRDKELRARLAGNARLFAEKEFSSSELFKRYSQLF